MREIDTKPMLFHARMDRSKPNPASEESRTITADEQAELLRDGWLFSADIATTGGVSRCWVSEKVRRAFDARQIGICRVEPGTVHQRMSDGTLRRNHAPRGVYILSPSAAQRMADSIIPSGPRADNGATEGTAYSVPEEEWVPLRFVIERVAHPVSTTSLISFLQERDMGPDGYRFMVKRDVGKNLPEWRLEVEVALRIIRASRRWPHTAPRSWWRTLSTDELLGNVDVPEPEPEPDPPVVEPPAPQLTLPVEDTNAEPEMVVEARAVLLKLLRDDDSIVRCLAAWAVLTTTCQS